MRDHDRDRERGMDTRNDNANFMDHSEDISRDHAREQQEQDQQEQERLYHHHQPPPHVVHTQPSDIFNDIDRTTYIIIFVAFILGFFMGKTMNPVIIRGSI